MPKKLGENILTVVAKSVGSAMGTIANRVGMTERVTQSAPAKRAKNTAKLPKARTKSYVKKKSAHKQKIAKHTAG